MRRLCYRLSASLLLVLIAVGGIRAQTDTPAKPTAVHELQRASRDHDRAWHADHVGYLLRYHGSAVAVIRNRSDFLRNDETVVSDRLHSAVEMQGPERLKTGRA